MVDLAAKQYESNMRVAVITGSSLGIGEAIARKYANENYRVFTVARSAMSSLSTTHFHIQADLSHWTECQRVGEIIKSEINHLDVLINNVGRSEWKSISKIDESFFNSMMALNVASYVSMTNALMPILGAGSIITNISSIAGKRGSLNNSIYCASKFAVNGLTQSWAKEFGPKGIRVNAICPVLIQSEGLTAALIKPDAPAESIGIIKFMNDFKNSQSALAHLPVAQDIADFSFYLSSAEARSITGQCINLDSGVFPQ